MTAQKGFEVSVKMDNVGKGKIVLGYMKSDNYFVNTNAVVKSGVYIFKGSFATTLLSTMATRFIYGGMLTGASS